MNIVSYNPNEVANIPAMMNQQIAESTDNFIMFVFDSIANEMIDKQACCNAYKDFMLRFNLPFMIFPYYMHFNKILPDSIAKPNPRATIKLHKTGEVFDVIGQAAYGMLIVNKQRLSDIEFKFNERYAKAFYVQDLINRCYEKKIWLSNQYLIDIHNSWMMFKSNIREGYSVPPQIFLAEKEEFSKNNNDASQAINEFIQLLKTNYGESA